jgi:hypothetical protein
LQEVLLKRLPWMSFLKETENEEEVERNFFKNKIRTLKDSINEHKKKYKIV